MTSSSGSSAGARRPSHAALQLGDQILGRHLLAAAHLGCIPAVGVELLGRLGFALAAPGAGHRRQHRLGAGKVGEGSLAVSPGSRSALPTAIDGGDLGGGVGEKGAQAEALQVGRDLGRALDRMSCPDSYQWTTVPGTWSAMSADERRLSR